MIWVPSRKSRTMVSLHAGTRSMALLRVVPDHFATVRRAQRPPRGSGYRPVHQPDAAVSKTCQDAGRSGTGRQPVVASRVLGRPRRVDLKLGSWAGDGVLEHRYPFPPRKVGIRPDIVKGTILVVGSGRLWEMVTNGQAFRNHDRV